MSDTTSDISSLHERPVGDEQRLFADCENNRASDRRASSANEVLTADEAWRISQHVCSHYKGLARELELTEVELREIEDEKNGTNPNREKALAVLHKWRQKRGSDATKGCLAFALDKINRRDIAESLIGPAYFLGKKKDQHTFILKEEARLDMISICEDKDGELYRLEKLERQEIEEFKKFRDAVQERRRSRVVCFDKTFGVEKMQKRKLESVAEQLRMHETDLKETENVLDRQERQEDKIEIAVQLNEDEKQTKKMEVKASSLIQLAEDTSYDPKENSIPKKIYDLSIFLNTVVQDLEERAKRLIGIINKRDKEKELKPRLEKLSERCVLLRNLMEEKIYKGSLKELTIQRYYSAPAQSTKDKVPDESISFRHNTVPKSSKEQKEMEEQIKPQKDPMEKDVR